MEYFHRTQRYALCYIHILYIIEEVNIIYHNNSLVDLTRLFLLFTPSERLLTQICLAI